MLLSFVQSNGTWGGKKTKTSNSLSVKLCPFEQQRQYSPWMCDLCSALRSLWVIKSKCCASKNKNGGLLSSPLLSMLSELLICQKMNCLLLLYSIKWDLKETLTLSSTVMPTPIRCTNIYILHYWQIVSQYTYNIDNIILLMGHFAGLDKIILTLHKKGVWWWITVISVGHLNAN